MVYSLHFVVMRLLDNFHRQIYCKWSPTSYRVHDTNYEIQQQSVAIKKKKIKIDLYFVICDCEFAC